MIDSAVIIAAGRGERLRPLTDERPKPLIEVGKEPLLNRVVSQMLKYHIKNIYYSLGYMWESVLAHIQKDSLLRECFGGCFIDPSMPGTAYWIYKSIMANCDMPILVSTSDNPMEIDIDAVRLSYDDLNQPACMMIPVRANGNAGTKIEYDEAWRRVTHVVEGKCHSGCFIGSGMQVINPKKIVSLTRDPLASFLDVWLHLIKLSQLYVSGVIPTKWYAIDDMSGLARARVDLE